ncbi:MAG: hypothetical protein EXS31_01145 [Pedosphaera sp.]|nr:hypothetical protein [Pedosphaera sp.]
MKVTAVQVIQVVSLPILLMLSACSKEEAPPKPVAIEQAPATLDEVFKEPAVASATKPRQDSQVKELVADARAALTGRDYSKALFSLQSLSGRSDLTDSQRDFVTRAMSSVHNALEEQAGRGDKAAQDALDLRRATK